MYSTSFEGKTYEGTASSKKSAKRICCSKLIEVSPRRSTNGACLYNNTYHYTGIMVITITCTSHTTISQELPSSEMISYKRRVIRDKSATLNHRDHKSHNQTQKTQNGDLRHTISQKIQRRHTSKVVDLKFMDSAYVKETFDYLKEKSVNYNFVYSVGNGCRSRYRRRSRCI